MDLDSLAGDPGNEEHYKFPSILVDIYKVGSKSSR